MPKKEYVQAKKEIEALMYENVDGVAKFGISKWSDVWDSSFETKNILEEGKVIDFTYSEKALSLQSVLNEGVDKAIEVARAINTPAFFNYLLGEVKIEGLSKTYNLPHVWTDKKYFNISQAKSKKYYTSKLLLALVNIAPEGSQAYNLRKETKKLSVLSFSGIHSNFRGVRACEFNFNYIEHFEELENLHLYGVSNLKNAKILKNFKQLSDLKIEGASYRNGSMYSDFKKCESHIYESLPSLKNIPNILIEDIANTDLTFLRDIVGENIYLNNCKKLQNLSGLNFTKLSKLSIFNTADLNDVSLLNSANKIQTLNISYDMVSAINSLDISCIESLTSIVNLSLGNCNFSHLKDFTKLIKLKQLSITSSELVNLPDIGENLNFAELSLRDIQNLKQLNGISGCLNLKKIYLDQLTNLETISDFPKVQCIDFKLNKCNKLKNLDFLENTSLISNYMSLNNCFDVSYDRSEAVRLQSGKNKPIGFDNKGYVIPGEPYDDGSFSEYSWENRLELENCNELNNIRGLRNITNLMILNFTNCYNIKSLDGLEKMLDLREIDLTGCTSLESIHALKNCSKLEKIMVAKCDNISPKPKVKNMDTSEKVQEYLAKL